MTKDLKDLIDNIYQLAMNSRDTSAVTLMVGTIHAVDEALLVLTKERDEARREVCKSAGILRSVVDPNQDVDEWANYIAKVNNWDCFKKEETP